MPNIIIKQSYSHINRSLPDWDTPNGRIVKNKDHYDRLMKENGMVSYEQMQKHAEGKKLKDYELSERGKSLIRSVSGAKDSKGRVKLGDRAIKAMVDMGAIGKKIPDYMKLPDVYNK